MVRDPQVDDNTERESGDAGDEAINPSNGAEHQADGTDETKTGSMEEELEAERQRAAEYLDQAQRARAEFVNYRRRTEEELARMQTQAGERIISKLLPAIDDLDRAIESMSEEERVSSWGEGIILVQKKIWSTLESEGVSPIDAVGKPFDPAVHEAISMQEGANGATTVIQEFQRGFMLGDRVLRPSMVVVGSAEDAPEPNESEDQHDDEAESNTNDENE
jgi:molecular chaperone GrpE